MQSCLVMQQNYAETRVNFPGYILQAMPIPRVCTHQGKLTHLHESLLTMGDLQKLKDMGKRVANVMEHQFAVANSV